MASFPSMVLTNTGKNMIAQAQLGQELLFTKGKYGDGILSGVGDQQDFTDLISAKLNLPIQGMINEEVGKATITVLVDRTDLTTGFFGRELGLFAKIGEAGIEQLFCYTNAGSQADYIPSGNDSTIPYNEFIDITTIIGNAASVSIIVDQTKIYATREQLDGAIESLSNFNGCTDIADGERGFVPMPIAGDQDKFLKGNGQWEALALATQAEAEAGIENTKTMTALRVAQAIDKKITDDTVEVAVVTETYENGDSWYRMWSDGWIEQGGKITITKQSDNTINFITPFVAEVKFLNFSPWFYTNNGDDSGGNGIVSTGTNLAIVRIGEVTNNSGSLEIFWEAVGK